jgi:tRNA G46 methylase TrmB
MINKLISNQFKKPSGFLGKVIASLMAKGNQHAYSNILSLLNVSQTDVILEIGFGPGFGIKELLRKHPSCKIVGVDFSELMYAKVLKKTASI